MTVINHMVGELMQDRNSTHNRKISREVYDQWARGFVFEAMRNQRYGQSFCNHFGITDNILFYSTLVSEADLYIQKNYVK